MLILPSKIRSRHCVISVKSSSRSASKHAPTLCGRLAKARHRRFSAGGSGGTAGGGTTNISGGAGGGVVVAGPHPVAAPTVLEEAPEVVPLVVPVLAALVAMAVPAVPPVPAKCPSPTSLRAL